MLILPYKVKNPAKHFPYATAGIIGVNVLVFIMTSFQLVIRPEIVDRWAMRWGESSAITVITALFLHGNILHLVGNMLFLWVFGQAVEDRMRPALYLALYFFTGFAAFAAQAALGSTTVAGVAVPCIGASGCIMGVVGAYWYLYSWSPVCMFYWFGFAFCGKFEVKAFWVIGFYFALDLINGMLARSEGMTGGVANFAHVGGAVAGAVTVWALQFRRDSREISEIRAAQADFGSVNELGCVELANLVDSSPQDEELLLAYAKKAWQRMEEPHLRAALYRNPRAILLALPDAVADYLVILNGTPNVLTPGELIYMGQYCERARQAERALRVYEILQSAYPNSPEVELALYRGAMVCFHMFQDRPRTQEKLQTLISRYPTGSHVLEAEDILDSINRQKAA